MAVYVDVFFVWFRFAFISALAAVLLFIFLLRTLCWFFILYHCCQFMWYLYVALYAQIRSLCVKRIEIVCTVHTQIYWMFLAIFALTPWLRGVLFTTVSSLNIPKTNASNLAKHNENWMSVHKINLHTKLPHSIQTKWYTYTPTPLKNGYYYFQSNDVGFHCSSAFSFLFFHIYNQI